MTTVLPNHAARAFALDDKYTLEQGTILLSGVQALVRVPLDQHRADARAGLRTATFISGYRGSPLGGFDTALHRAKRLLDTHSVVFQPGINEDLGATAVFGSQIANLYPGPRYDGVLGMWYGKAPGVDRSGDVFKHANFAGVGKYGGVLAVAGDDPVSKSSTLPSASEIALYDAQMPILYPGNVQEIIELGRYGFGLSRYSGLWVGFKIVTNVADEFSTAQVTPVDHIITPEFFFDGKPWQPTQNTRLVAPFVLETERELMQGRLEAAKLFARANHLNRVVVSSAHDWIGIAAAGKTYYDVREALDALGFQETRLREHGIRLLKLNVLYPHSPADIREFAHGLQEIVVIEEKRAFVELFLRDALYELAERPRIIGKRDEHGNFFVRADGELDADQIVPLLVMRLKQKIPAERLKLSRSEIRINEIPLVPLALDRSPYFCSGCPHNRSTVVPEGSLAGGGIGCHGMVLAMERNTQGITHMGGEGAQWVGAAPFTETRHLFQNLGDGTLFHSGWLAIRQAIAANTNITYKILYNGSVAMTGGQPADGSMPIPELTQALTAEGVKKIIVCADDPKHYSRENFAQGVEVRDRDHLDQAQRLLREIPGVTVIVYDQPCAADLRRKRKRGLAPDPPLRVIINQAVCEGCGDCGVKSNCLSVVPVETEFGRKTQIHQPSCNKDYSCLLGDCPAFVTVTPGTRRQNSNRARIPDFTDLPEPDFHAPAETNIYMVGIGGTGVVTINQILGTAALLQGKYTRALDQTGLSQKGGPVASHLKISSAPSATSNKVGDGKADVYLVFDILGGAKPENLKRTRKDKTRAILSVSAVATGAMVRKTTARFPERDPLVRRINSHTRAEQNVYLDANAIAEAFYGTNMPANMLVVGAAYQCGLLPLSAANIEQAIELNGEAIGTNTSAFRVGRKLVLDPQWNPLQDALYASTDHIQPAVTPRARALIDSVDAAGELRRLLEIRVPELIAYQNEAYARAYVEFLSRVVERERSVTTETRWSEAVARYLFKLMAYKDEYEVARLQLQPEFRTTLVREFGSDARLKYLLHPPFLRALGMHQKIKFGKWFDPVYALLVQLRRLRGTPLDVFGYTHIRRTERALIQEYRALMENARQSLSPETYARAVQLAELPELIRGYEEIKLNNVKLFRERVSQIGVTA